MARRIIFEGFRQLGFQNLFALGPGAELFYSFVIILCSLMIYYGTKELYELSSHKGIKYFRQTFLFFASAYFVRSLIKFIVIYFNFQEIGEFSPYGIIAIGMLTQFLFVYLSSMSIFYLLYSLICTKWKENKIYLFHTLGIILAIVSIFLRSSAVYLLINLFILFVVISIIYISSKNRSNKKRTSMHIVYVLLSLFWILNIIDALIPNLFQGLQLFIYIASTGIFLLILYKVIKKTGAN